MIRTYRLQHDINIGKQESIYNALRAYREACTKIASFQWRLFFTEGVFNKMMDTKTIGSPLSERYKRNCCYQVEAMLKSFISNRQLEFVKIVYRSSVSLETRKHLLQINRRKLWFKSSDVFTAEELFLAKKIFKHVLNKNRKPSFRHINMTLNSNVAQIQTKQPDKAISFDYWIKLSTLEHGKPVLLPLKNNQYFDCIEGKILNSVQIIQSDNGFEIAFMKDVPPQAMIFRTNKIAIDIGLKTLFALHDGNMFGNGFYTQLAKYDSIINKLAKNRQRQGLRTSSAHYDAMVQDLREFIKNEVGRCLNAIVELYMPRVFVIENLNFQGTNLSRRMNRLLSNFGKGIIEQKLSSISETFGIEIQKINPAYTSQECNKCHYVDKENRKSQKHFKCKFCNTVINADVNAARNHFFRSSDGELANIYTGKNIILQKLVYRFLERQRRPYSWANDLLYGNPYFSGNHAQSKLERSSMDTIEYYVT